MINFRRILSSESMRFELHTTLEPESPPEDFDPEDGRNVERIREGVIAEMCELLDAADGSIGNPNRLYRDLLNREKRAGTAIGDGIAIPHVRTLQARHFTMAFARSREGLPFLAIDGRPVHLFFAMVAPPHEDRTYLKVYRSLATCLLQPETIDGFMQAESANEAWTALDAFR